MNPGNIYLFYAIPLLLIANDVEIIFHHFLVVWLQLRGNCFIQFQQLFLVGNVLL